MTVNGTILPSRFGFARPPGGWSGPLRHGMAPHFRDAEAWPLVTGPEASRPGWIGQKSDYKPASQDRWEADRRPPSVFPVLLQAGLLKGLEPGWRLDVLGSKGFRVVIRSLSVKFSIRV